MAFLEAPHGQQQSNIVDARTRGVVLREVPEPAKQTSQPVHTRVGWAGITGIGGQRKFFALVLLREARVPLQRVAEFAVADERRIDASGFRLQSIVFLLVLLGLDGSSGCEQIKQNSGAYGPQ